MSSTAVLAPQLQYEDLIKDPELNDKVRKVVQLLRENGLTPAHAIFAIALTYRGAQESCPCGNPAVHRLTSLDEVCEMFLDAYDCAQVKPAAGQG